MMKKILVPILLILGIAGFYLAQNYYYYPKKMLNSWLRGQDFNDWYNLETYGKHLFVNQTNKVEPIRIKNFDAANLWQDFHVGEFLVPLPFRHPMFIAAPQIKYLGKETPPQLGFEFINQKQKKVASIMLLPKAQFKFKNPETKLFKVPFFQQYINDKTYKEKWRDIFELKYSDMPKDYKVLSYYLYILHQRSQFINTNTLAFDYFPNQDLAIIEIKAKDKDFKHELIIKNLGGILYSFYLSTKVLDDEAKLIRNRLLTSIKFSPDSIEASKPIYDQFKNLPYEQQVTNDGLLYLFTAWSHDIDNKEFLRVMIQFLERGKDNLKFLDPLYSYSYQKYGTSYSKIDENLKEKAEEEFKRKLEEENKQERLEAERRRVLELDIDKLSPKERLEYRLKKAKENKIQSSDDKVLIVD